MKGTTLSLENEGLGRMSEEELFVVWKVPVLVEISLLLPLIYQMPSSKIAVLRKELFLSLRKAVQSLNVSFPS